MNEKYLKKIQPLVEEINKKEEEYQELSEDDLKANTDKFKERIEKGETVDDGRQNRRAQDNSILLFIL